MKEEYRKRLDQRIDRSRDYTMKWDAGSDVLPFWVADMDLACSPEIEKAIQKRAASPIYGYTDIPASWAKAYASWFSRRHGWDLQEDQLIYTNGVICGLSSLVRRFSVPHEKVIVLTPVYSMFFNSIINNGREPLCVPLDYDGRSYSLNMDRLEEAMADPQASLMILCNPHNPTGNIWGREQLEAIAQAAAANGVLIISDEVHGDLTRPGISYTPLASIGTLAADQSLTLLSPSKAFNVAGIHTAAITCANPVLGHRAWRAVNTDEVGEPNVFSIPAAIAAYDHSEEYLEAVREYVFENRDLAMSFIEKEIPEITCIPSDALYLMWMDVSRLCKNSSDLAEFLEREAKIQLSDGNEFRPDSGAFVRMNLACPKSMLEEGLDRLKRGIEQWKKAGPA